MAKRVVPAHTGECLVLIDELLGRLSVQQRHEQALRFQNVVVQSADYSRKVFCLDWIRQYNLESKL
eukprot:scaffold388_cov380-Prasinococcus_capsulatus_cf.AAC.6